MKQAQRLNPTSLFSLSVFLLFLSGKFWTSLITCHMGHTTPGERCYVFLSGMWSYWYLKSSLSPACWSQKWSPLCSSWPRRDQHPVPDPQHFCRHLQPDCCLISNLSWAQTHHQACDGPVKAAGKAETERVDSIERTHDYPYKSKCCHLGQAWIQSALEKMKGPWLQRGITAY